MTIRPADFAWTADDEGRHKQHRTWPVKIDGAGDFDGYWTIGSYRNHLVVAVRAKHHPKCRLLEHHGEIARDALAGRVGRGRKFRMPKALRLERRDGEHVSRAVRIDDHFFHSDLLVLAAETLGENLRYFHSKTRQVPCILLVGDNAFAMIATVVVPENDDDKDVVAKWKVIPYSKWTKYPKPMARILDGYLDKKGVEK